MADDGGLVIGGASYAIYDAFVGIGAGVGAIGPPVGCGPAVGSPHGDKPVVGGSVVGWGDGLRVQGYIH